MDPKLAAALDAHHVLVDSDNAFQQRARLLQALWRERQDLPHGVESQTSYGSRLEETFARREKANLMTPAARDAATAELTREHQSHKPVIEENRLWTNLLSSQPLAFNLFGELQADKALASRVLRRLWPTRVAEVTRVGFEHSPGLLDPKYTHDKTAFDVYFEHTTPAGSRGFIGLEVKYHEALGDPPAKHKARYDEITERMKCFRSEHLLALREKPVHQIWRDHMLAGAMQQYPEEHGESALYVFLYPADNVACRKAVARYRELLVHEETFAAVTLEEVVDALDAETGGAAWVKALRDRYLAWEKVDAVIAAAGAG